MKKTLSLILAVAMLLGCMSITAFATTDNTTDITLTVAKSLTYDMVIPEDVTDLSNFGIYSVGQAKVQNVKNATEKTVISYTAETTAFKCEGKTDIPASYYTDAQGTNTFPTTAVEVYKSKADAANIPTMYVRISETDWNAAENGTYTATVTFNFSAEEKEAVVTIADILPEDFPTSYAASSWIKAGFDPVPEMRLYLSDEFYTFAGMVLKGIAEDSSYGFMLALTDVLTKTGENQYTWGDNKIIFNLSEDVLESVEVIDCPGGQWQVNGTFTLQR